MKFKIHSSKLLIADKKAKGVRQITIRKSNKQGHLGITRFGDVFNCLPAGLLHKDETGMGATTLEINTPRNSIIVEPIKITASSKAYKHSVLPGNKVLYVGSETKYHPQKITKKEIVDYLNNPAIPFKKIIVVADSLKRVIEAAGPDVYKDYFLLLDEADSFQMDSTFRKSMELCIDIYMQFDKDNRCMVSATLLDFSDPKLSNEDKTVIGYDKQSVREIQVIQTNTTSLLGNVADKITELLKTFPKEKIMVAFNSVKGCFSLAEEIVLKGVIDKTKVKLLCSKNSKDKVIQYYEELNSDELPAKLNFVTSAYFTGFDLNERYHLISVSGNKNGIQALSDSRLKQIAGRCRVGLLSETIIHDIIAKDVDSVQYSKDDLLAAAITELDAMKCMHKHYSKNPLLKIVYDQLSELILNSLESSNKRFIRKKEGKQEPEISYLNIDAFLETNKTRHELYSDFNTLTKTLKKDGHNVKETFKSSNTKVDIKDIDTPDRAQKITVVIDFLKQKPSMDDIQGMIKSANYDRLQTKIAEQYINLSRYIDPDNLLDELQRVSEKSDSRQLNNFLLAASYAVYPTGNNYKSRMNKYFPVGKSYSSTEILKRLNLVFTECSIPKSVDSETTAVRLLKCHLNCKRKRDSTYSIVGENPLNLKVTNTKTELEEINNIIGILHNF